MFKCSIRVMLCAGLVTAAGVCLGQMRDRETDVTPQHLKPRTPIDPAGPQGPQTLGDVVTGISSEAETGAEHLRGDVTLDVDQYLAGCLLTANEGEISICEMAANRAKRADVKKLAQEMADEHRPLSRQLQPLAGTESTTQGSEISAGDNVPGSDAAVRTDKMTDVVPQRPVGPERNPSLGSKPGDASATQNVARDASPRISQSVNQLADADRRIHQAVTKRIRSELEQQPEAQFDAAFLNCHAVAQIEMIGVAEVIQQQSPGRLAQIAQQASAVAEGDLKQVQQLLSRHPGATTDQSAKSPEK